MEVFVHLAGGIAPASHVLVRIEIPDDIAAAAEDVTPLPLDWQRIPAPASTRDIGTRWAGSGSSVLLRVPSVVIPTERNFLINPQHPEFVRITAAVDSTFTFDPRMIARRGPLIP
jgi:RES domain-containing protein